MIKYWLFFVSLIIVVGIFFIYKISYKLFDKYNDTRLDPIQFSNIKIDSAQNYNFVFLGDSHCQYWKTSKTNILNIGLTGQTSEQIKIKTQLIQDKLKGDNIVLSIGANDVKSVSTNPERIQEITNICFKNIIEVLKIVKPKFKKTYIITIPPDFNVGWQQRIFNYNSTLEAKKLINNKIRLLPKSENLKIIDTEKLFQNKENMSSDGVHMNENAYKIIDKYLK